MREDEIDWEDQWRKHAVIDEAREFLGRRFGGAWLNEPERSRHLHIATTELTQEISDRLSEIASRQKVQLVMVLVPRSEEELTEMVYGPNGVAEVVGGSVTTAGSNVMNGTIEATLSRFDADTVAELQSRVPSDLLRVEINPYVHIELA